MKDSMHEQAVRTGHFIDTVYGGSSTLYEIAKLTFALSLSPGQEKYEELASVRRALIKSLTNEELQHLVSAD